MKNKIILEFIKNETLEAFQSKEVVKRNVGIIAIDFIIAYLISSNNHFFNITFSLFIFQMFLTSISIVCVLSINTIIIKYNANKNNASNYKHVLKYSQYIKFSVFSAIFFQVVFIFVKIFNFKSNFITILGFLVFFNIFLNLIFAVNTIAGSFEEPIESHTFNFNKVNLRKKDSH